MELVCGLLGVLILGVVVAIVGHMLWTMGAWLVRSTSEPQQQGTCPTCAKPIRREALFCDSCGFHFGEPQRPTLESDLEATKRQLNRLMSTGRISAAMFDEVSAAIRRDAFVRAGGERKTEVDAATKPGEAPTVKPVQAVKSPAPVEAPPVETQPVETAPVESAVPPATPAPSIAAFELVEPIEYAEPVESIDQPPSAAPPVRPAAVIPHAWEIAEHEPTRGVAAVLQSFMEEKNIRWGELLSGLMIVVASVGLVISLWATLKEAIPYFPVAVFVTATAAMHGAGLYTLKRWRLKTTSRGLLVISTLLVPLNMLAAILLNERKPVYETIDYVAVGIGLALLSALVFSAARILNRHNPWPMFVAVTGAAVGISVIGRQTVPRAAEWRTLLLIAIPFGSYLVGAFAHIGRLAAGHRLSTRRTAQSFRFFGIALFALAVATALLAAKSGNVLGTFSLLSPLVSLLAATITAAGLVVQQRTTAVRDAGYRTAGTAIALGGGLLVIAAVILAWPRPDLLVEVGLLNAVAFSLLGWFAAMPTLHLFATSSFALACLVGFPWARGRISVASATSGQLAALLLEAQSAFLLALLSLVSDAIASLLTRTKAKPHAAGYFASAVLQAGLAVAMSVYALVHEVPDQNFVTAVFAVLALRWLVAAWWIRRSYASWIGAALLLAALAHGLGMNSTVQTTLAAHGLSPVDPGTMALLLHATICTAYAVLARLTRRHAEGTEPDRALVFPLSAAAVASAALAIPAMALVSNGHFLPHAGYAFWTAAIWFVTALMFGAPTLAAAAQTIGTLGVVYGVVGYCRRQDWWSGSYLTPLHLNWQLGALAIWSGLWIVARHASRRIDWLSRVFKSGLMSVERILLGTVVVGLAATCWAGCLPGVFAETTAVGNTASRWLVYYGVTLVPFGLAAILTASHAIFVRIWREVSVIAIGFLVAFVAMLSLAPRADLWPGLPSPYGQGWGAGAWPALGLTALTLVAASWERATKATLAGLTLLAATVPFLIACRWDQSRATASALRWTWAVVALAIAVLWSFRGTFPHLGRRVDRSESETDLESTMETNALWIRNAFIAIGGFSILAISVQNVCTLVSGRLAAGPLAGSFFARIGAAESDAVPLVLLAASFLVYLIAERKALWGMSATFLAQFAFGLVCCYSVALSPQAATFADLVRFLQEMGLSAGVTAIFWLAVEQFIVPRLFPAKPDAAPSDGTPLRAAAMIQLVLAGIVTFLLTAGATYGLWIAPAPLWNSVHACGSPLAWSLLALVAAGWCLVRRAGWPRSIFGPAVVCLAAAVPAAAASLATWNAPANWLSYHTAIAGWCGLIGIAVGGGLRRQIGSRRETNLESSPLDRAGSRGGMTIADGTLLLTPLIVLFLLKGEWNDPFRPWWSAGPALWLSLCTIVSAAGALSRRRAYLSLGFAVLGSVFIGLQPWLGLGKRPIDQDALNLVYITVIGAAIQALLWIAIEILHDRRGRPLVEHSSWLPPQHVVAVVGTAACGFPVAVLATQRFFDFTPQPMFAVVPGGILGWSALALVACLSFALLWERGARQALPLLYLLGLTAIATSCEGLELSRSQFIIAAICSAAGYVVITGVLWAFRSALRTTGLRLGMPPADAPADTNEGRVPPWLSAANLVISLLVIVAGFWIVLKWPEFDQRLAASLATLATAVGIALLTTGPRRRQFQIDALVVGVLAAVQIGWAVMDVGQFPHEELRRAIRVLVTLAATAFVYGVPLVRLLPAAGSWFQSIRRVAIGVAVAAVVSLGLILVFEFVSFNPASGTAVTTADSIIVAVALGLLAVGLVSLALLPGRDPFLSTERQRFGYVYAGEAVAGLLFGHLYLTNPQFFHQLLQPYWPLIVMGIAFGGVGLSELFGRLKINVLAKPVEHTAAFLPVLPLLGFWLVKPDLQYSTTLIAVGLLYLLLSLRRGSFVYSAAAAIVGNMTICWLFAEHGVSLLVHPQMFIIPPCVTVLAAAQLNRDRLTASALATVRYCAITTIYVSSTGEMFQHGIGTTLWLPIVLAGLSVLGVLAGIALRVRAFLYLGTAFLLLSVVSMVWHAAQSLGQTWPWWVSLFTLGFALLILFGIFEKKRKEMLGLIEQLRQWER